MRSVNMASGRWLVFLIDLLRLVYVHKTDKEIGLSFSCGIGIFSFDLDLFKAGCRHILDFFLMDFFSHPVHIIHVPVR